MTDAVERKNLTQKQFNNNQGNIEVVRTLTNSYQDQIESIEVLTKKTKEAAEANEAFNKSSIAVNGIGPKLKSWGKNIGNIVLGAATGMIVETLLSSAANYLYKVLDDIAHRQEKIIERGQVAKKIIDETKAGYDEKESFINENGKEFVKLASGVDLKTNKNLSLSTEEYERFLSVSAQLTKLFPQLVSGYDSQGNALINLSGDAGTATDQLARLLDQERQLANYKIAENLQDDFKGVWEQDKIISERLKESYEKRDKEEKAKAEAENNINNNKSLGFESLYEEKDWYTGEVSKLLERRIDMSTESGKAIADAIKEAAEKNNLDYPETFFLEDGLSKWQLRVPESQINQFYEDYSTALKGKLVEVGQEASEELNNTLIQINTDERERKALWNLFMPDVVTSMQVYDEYNKFGEEVKQLINSAISNIDLDSLTDEQQADMMNNGVRQFFRKMFVDPVADIDGETEKAFDSIIDVYTDSSLSAYKKVQKINKLRSGKGVDSSAIGAILQTLGIQDGSVYFPKVREEIEEIMSRNSNLSFNDLFNLTDQERSIAFDLVVNDGFSGTFDLLWKKIQELMNAKPSIALSSIFSDEGFNTSVDNFQENMTTIQTAIDSLKKGELAGDALIDLQQQFPELATEAQNLGQALTDLSTDKLISFAAAMRDSFKDLTDPAEIKAANDFIRNAASAVDLSNISSKKVKDQIKNRYKEAGGRQGDIDEKTKNTLSGLSDLLSTDLGRELVLKVSLETDFNDMSVDKIRAEANRVLQSMADNLELPVLFNNEEFNSTITEYQNSYTALAEAKKKLNSGTFDKDRDMEALIRLEPRLARETGKLEDSIDDLLETSDNDILRYFSDQIKVLREAGRNAEADALQNYADSVMNSVHDVEIASIQLGGVKFKLPDFEESSNPGEASGATFESMKQQYQTAKELWEKGEIGNPAFTTFAKMISPTGSADAANFAENLQTFEKYFTDGADGAVNFLNTLKDLGYATQEGDEWTYTLGHSMEEFETAAQQAGMGLDEFLAMLGRLEDYGFKNDFFFTEEEGIQHTKDLYSELAKEQLRLAEIEANPNVSNYETAKEQCLNNIADLQERISNSQESINELDEKNADFLKQKAEITKETAKRIQELRDNSTNEWEREAYQNTLDDYMKQNRLILDVNGDFTSIEEAAENLDLKIDFDARGTKLDDQISQLTDKLNSGTLDASELTELQGVLGYLIDRKQELTAPAVMKIDATQLNSMDENISYAVSAIQDYQTAYNELQKQQSLGLDTTEAKAGLDEAKEKLQQIDENTQKTLNFEIKGLDDTGIVEAINHLNLDSLDKVHMLKYEFNITNEEEFDSFLSKLDTLADGEPKTISVNIDQGNFSTEQINNLNTALATFKEANPETTVVVHGAAANKMFTDIENKRSNLDGSKATVSVIANGASYVLTTLRDLSSSISNLDGKSATVTINRKTINSSSNESVSANGNAHANGSPRIKSAFFNDGYLGARANGSWGEAKDTEALTGELGQELVVRGNRFFTVGDNGPEMVHLKKGDIVFNHLQTKDILTKGYTTGRGRALAEGNARHGTGKTPGTQGGASSSSGKTSSAKSSSGKSNTTQNKSGDKASKAIDDIIKSLDKLFDWIEVRLNRIQRDIDIHQAKSDNSIGYAAKNKELTNAQADTRLLIDANTRGAAKYKSKANDVYNKFYAKLNKTDKKTFKNAYDTLKAGGDIRIDSYNENVRTALEKTKEWYDKFLDCDQAAIELEQSLRDLAQTKMDNISDQFEAMLNHIDHSATLIQGYMDQTEARGYIQSAKYYDALIANKAQQKANLEKEQAELVKSLQGSMADGIIKKGSIEWYDMQTQINEVTQAIQEADTEILEFRNDIRDIDRSIFDRILDDIGRIAEESDFLIDLMSEEKLFDDRGMWTSQGTATAGLIGTNYDTYMAQSEKYAERVKKLNNEIANDKNNVKLIDERNELLKLQQQSIKAAEDEQQAMKNLVKEGIDKQLESLRKLIDEYTDALDSAKDLSDYSKSVKEQAENVAALQKRLDSLRNDDSEEGKQRKHKTEQELKKAKEDLEETQYDRYISDQKDLLDSLYDSYEEILNKRLDNVDLLMQDMIDYANANTGDILDTLQAESANVGYTMTEQLQSIWSQGNTALSGYQADFDNRATSFQNTIDRIEAYVAGLCAAADKEAAAKVTEFTTNNSKNPSSVTPPPAATPPTQSGGGTNAKPAEEPKKKDDAITKILKSGITNKKTVAAELKKNHSPLWHYIYDNYHNVPTYKIYGQLAKKLGINLKGDKATLAESNKILKTLKSRGYATGSKRIGQTQFAPTQEKGGELIRLADGSVLTPLDVGSRIYNALGTENIWRMAENPRSFIANNLGNLPTRSTSVNNTIQANFNLPNVTNYEEFIAALQKDKRFERLVQDVTVGQMNGRSSLGKYKTKF